MESFGCSAWGGAGGGGWGNTRHWRNDESVLIFYFQMLASMLYQN